MKKLVTILAASLLLALSFGSALAQISSAKGSAAVSNAVLIEATDMTHSWDEVLATIIQVPQQKELVFDVALQCGLYTDTLVRSKGGTRDTSTAEVGIDVRVKLEKVLGVDAAGELILGPAFFAHPGGEDFGVTFAKREQSLMAKFQGIFQACEVRDPETGECLQYGANTCLIVEEDDLGNHTTQLDMACLDYEEVQLILDTVNANAFNFVSADLTQGEYKVTVEAQITSSTDAVNGTAGAKGLVGLGSMVVDEVRFVKGDTGGGL